MRWLSLGSSVLLIGMAFLAATRVADTREGLVYEVITLLSALAGVGLLLYVLVARPGRPRPTATAQALVRVRAADSVPSANELVIGVAGLVVGALLVSGLAATAGPLWALIGLVALLPMIAGCAYMCYRFARAPKREWRIDLQRLTGRR